MFEHSIAQGLEAATGPNAISFGYKVGDLGRNTEEKQRLRELLEKYKSKEYKQTPLLDNFDEIASIIGGANYNDDSFRAGLLMIYDACIRKELQ